MASSGAADAEVVNENKPTARCAGKRKSPAQVL